MKNPMPQKFKGPTGPTIHSGPKRPLPNRRKLLLHTEFGVQKILETSSSLSDHLPVMKSSLLQGLPVGITD
jgi:hypothetical protein